MATVRKADVKGVCEEVRVLDPLPLQPPLPHVRKAPSSIPWNAGSLTPVFTPTWPPEDWQPCPCLSHWELDWSLRMTSPSVPRTTLL